MEMQKSSLVLFGSSTPEAPGEVKQESGVKDKTSDKTAEPIKHRLQRLLTSQHMSDVTLIVGKQPTLKTFKVHKLLLGMGSEVFQAMFYGTMAEAENEIKFPEDDTEAFEIMIRYLYLGAIELDNLKTTISVYRVSDKYLVPELKKLCIDYLSMNINVEVAIEIYELSIATVDHRLEKASYQYIQRNVVQILFQQSRFKEARMSTLQKILADEALIVQTEIQVYEAVVYWGKEQCRRQEEEATPTNIRQKIEPLLSEIRFLCMAANDFVKGPARDGILNESEQLLILKNILVPGSGRLPPICNSNRKGRSASLTIPSFRFPWNATGGTTDFGSVNTGVEPAALPSTKGNQEFKLGIC